VATVIAEPTRVLVVDDDPLVRVGLRMLLNGDDLKVVFNENGTSSLTIAGVTFNATGLGLTAISGTGCGSRPSCSRRCTSCR